jgi:DNA-binding IclR family transcriptional regulator
VGEGADRIHRSNEGRHLQSVARAARILQCFTGHTHGHTLSEIARCCKFNVATTHRVLQTLCATGLLEREPGTEVYEVGPLCRALAAASR